MGLGDVTRAGVLAAVQESRHRGREAFRRHHGFGRALAYELVLDGHRYDSKAIAGVAHLYSTGSLLTADDFSGGARTVAHRLRTLGFTVDNGAPTSDEPQPAAPQLVLQPRGGARDRGPQNFARSVRQGIALADIRDELGSQADTLAALYLDGIARLWGSTPTTQTNNEKARALRGRHAGDTVLFYAENHFIARARILHLFDSLRVARTVWGTDEEDATWQHIMALGDLEAFPAPVPAAPILQSLNVPAPLRSLTLRSAEDHHRINPLLPQPRRPDSAPALAGRPGAPEPLTPATLLERIGTLHTHHHLANEAPSRHQPLTLLWALARIAAGKPRVASWSCFRSEVGPLLAEFGLPGSKVTPEYPFWHLRNSGGLWEVHGINGGNGFRPRPGILDEAQPVAGLTLAAAELLNDPLNRLEAVVRLYSTYLGDIDQHELFSRVGLLGYATADGLTADTEDRDGREDAEDRRTGGPAGRRETTSSRLVRDTALASRVKELHGYTCQVCAARLQYKRRPYSEAAHIRGLGSPHHGPDELRNLLCLCPNHHVLFDGLEIYIDTDNTVRHTQGHQPLGQLRRHPGHSIDETHLHYHRTLCKLNRLTTQ
ncbi:HNH endonuclease [Streptomyces adustus]|uniref:HNH endonuclease n=1 Tax=Streptomyces adustus TaxID=1609272 RepID=UPI003718D9B4